MAAEPLLCIMGPTASGKTALAVELAEALGGELISVDSVLVYRGLDIGAAKPDYPHHLVDICDPAEVYSAARFARDARKAIADIRARGRRPILVGGTMLYYRALLQGLDPLPAADETLRRDIAARARRLGWPALHEELARRDPVAAARIHPNHSQRITRALEVCLLTGSPISDAQRCAATNTPVDDAICFALAPADRGELHRRIATRFEEMLAAGFVDEVRALRRRGDLHTGLPALRSVGYRQLWDYLEGRWELEEATRRGVAATRQLAKRQLTWLRKWPDLRWLLTDDRGMLHETGPMVSSCMELFGVGADPADVVLNYLGMDT